MNYKSQDSYEENRKPDISQNDVFDSILLLFPDIDKEDVKFLYHGTYNVFEVKNAYIFRFPDKTFRNESGVRLIQREIRILNSIREFISISIPDPEYISFDLDNPFLGYKKIEGISLSRCIQACPMNRLLKIGKEIGFFLTELHSQDVLNHLNKKRIIQSEFTPISYRESWYKYYEMVQKNIFPLLSEQKKAWIDILFLRFLENDANFNFNPAVIHGDFDTSNILINQNTFEVIGIIDFEETRIFDPAADFLFYEEGNKFLNQIMSNYKGNIDANFEERQRFLFGRTCLAYIEFGIKNGLSDMVNWGLKRLEIIKNMLK